MIIYRSWKQIKRGGEEKKRFIWHGWFLFGLIPLYLRRINID